MRKISILILAILFSIIAKAQEKKGDTALLIIDIQYFYYPGGSTELVDPEPAGKNAAKLLEHFRKNNLLVVHVRHNSKAGGEIHEVVKPLSNEKVISKDEVNCFKNTDLLDYLRTNKIKYLIICGMQTHMCVEAATRAAKDFDFDCTLIHDACATRNLKFGDKEIKAEDVHYSTLSTLKAYAKIIDTKAYLKE